ncbi:uncharacterized protein MELLADRAFT_69034 [Melampsora larici-populina 98AG31]|uniref:Uncharacterized protein n=1 Tax=Melampsora larici-populina (strain 98AG31 / pathotype 3-4-7) TaxID=747676 RepID=F4S963_MELLP|nr:uncharacterized protein MELLADRAFT_69034 [Melampsora larici-populina 98AG31]EGF98818.1 hypothetical protein MELLADRAFT_69034 [Melampsora larici-populina 98AG31]
MQATPGPIVKATPKQTNVERTLELNIGPSSEPNVNFSVFENSQLEELLQMVGVDGRMLERTALLEQCTSYQELIIIPDHFGRNVTQNNHLDMTTSEFTLQVPLGAAHALVQYPPSISDRTTTQVVQSSIENLGVPEISHTNLRRSEEATVLPEIQKVQKKHNRSKVFKTPKTRGRKTSIQGSEAALESAEGCTSGVGAVAQENMVPNTTQIERRRTSRKSTNAIESVSTSTHTPSIQVSSQGSKLKLSSNASTSKHSSEPGKALHAVQDDHAIKPLDNSSAHTESLKGKEVERDVNVGFDTDSPTPSLTKHSRLTRTRASLQATQKGENCAPASSGSPGPSSLPQESHPESDNPSTSTHTKSNPSYPSLEHRRFTHARPPPTIRPSPPPQRILSDSDWEPEADESVRASKKKSKTQKTQTHSANPYGSSNKPPSRSVSPQLPSIDAWTISDLRQKVAKDSKLIKHLQDETRQLTDKVDSLTNDFRHLSKTVSSMKKDEVQSKKKTRGGRLAVS